MNRVLVTGGAGFVGSQVVRELLPSGWDLYAMVRPGGSTKRLDAVRDGIHLLFAELNDHASTAGAVEAIQPDMAIHLAWYASPRSYLHDVKENLLSLDASIGLVRSLIDAACPRIVLAGTCLENGEEGRRSIYAAAKQALHVALGGAGLSTSVLCAHLFYLYGPREDERRAVPAVIRSLLKGEPIDVTAGEQIRDYLHVADAASALCSLAVSDVTGSAAVCSGTATKLSAVFEAIGQETGRQDLIKLGRLPRDNQAHFSGAGDSSVLADLGWHPSFSLKEGIKDTVAWWSTQTS